jgi:PAS domain S-box-containing protein
MEQSLEPGADTDFIDKMRAMNEALLISLVRHHEAAEQLRAGEERLRVVLDSVPLKVVTATPAGKLSYFNPQWIEYTGCTDEDMEGWRWPQLVHPDDAAKTEEVWQQSMATGEPFVIQHRLRRADGEYRWHVGRAIPTRNETGQITLWVCSDTDVEEVVQAEKATRARLEQEVRRRTSELLAANEQLQGFTYSVSHDLRQQIRGINTNASVLLRDFGDSLDGKSLETLKRMVASSIKLATLVNDLLIFARIGKQRPTMLPFDVTALAEEVAAFLIEKGIARPETRFSIAPGLAARGDVQLMQIVMENLLDNACKFSAEQDIPIVVVGRAGDAFFVRDNGIGFDMRYLDKLFQPFERLSNNEAYPGTGIGLANVKRIVEKHGGEVWAEGKAGEGATFYFSLGSECPD